MMDLNRVFLIGNVARAFTSRGNTAVAASPEGWEEF